MRDQTVVSIMTVDGKSQRSFRVIQVKERLTSLTEKRVKVNQSDPFGFLYLHEIFESF